MHEKTIVFVGELSQSIVEHSMVGIEVSGFQNTIEMNVPFRLYVVPGEELEIMIKYNANACKEKAVVKALKNLSSLIGQLIENSSITTDEWKEIVQIE